MVPVERERPGVRPDIEGLRAVAIGLVLLFHAGITFVPGGFVGVDVFFVISGFLITGLLVREVERTGRVSLARFWARRAKRLLPASALTLAVTALTSWLVLPETAWRSVGYDVAAAAAYVVNWRFAATAVDYDAEGTAASPVLHFWSLAVEEQFYLVWPLLVVLVAALARRHRRLPLRPALAVGIALVAVPSFAVSVVLTAQNPDLAFFVTPTRLWELGIGAVVAIGAGLWPRIPTVAAHALGWLGAAAVAVCALTVPSDAEWPGTLALAPTLGTAAVIVATTGRAPGTLGVGRVLGLRPLVLVGGMSYSWYLWHWPFLTIGAGLVGELGQKRSLALVLASGVVAWLSLHLVENPLRFSPHLTRSPRLALSLGANASLLGALAGTALVLAVPASSPGGSAPGAAVVAGKDLAQLGDSLAHADVAARIDPGPADARQDLPRLNRAGCISPQDTDEVVRCDRGDEDSATTVVAVGDSKIVQWTDALVAIAEREGWHLVTFLKSACAFTEPAYELDEPRKRNCASWNPRAMEEILALSPDVVVTSGRQVFGGDDEAGARMIAAWWDRLRGAGIDVVPILDNPAPPFEVYECVAENRESLSACAFDRDKAVRSSGARLQIAAAELTGVTSVVDMSDVTCPGATLCPAVVGDVLVYRQGSHLTRTFVESATDVLAERLVPLVEAAAAD